MFLVLLEMELEEELFRVRIPFRPELVFGFLHLTTWDLKQWAKISIEDFPNKSPKLISLGSPIQCS